MVNTVQKFSKILLVVYENDILFLIGGATCGIILQGFCKIYCKKIKNPRSKFQNRRRRRIINFIANKGGIIGLFAVLAVKIAPKISSSKTFHDAIYTALPYNFSDAEKRRRLVIAITNDKIRDKLLRRFLFFIKILEWASTLSLITIFIIYMIQSVLLLDPEIWEFAFSIVKFYKNMLIYSMTGQVPNDKAFFKTLIVWRFFMGGY